MKVYIGSSSTYEIYTKLALLLQDVNSTATGSYILYTNKLFQASTRSTIHYCPGQVPMGAQLKHQNLSVRVATRRCFKWLDYPHTRAHPGWEVSCQGYRINLHHRFVEGQPDSGESCIMLQSRSVHSFVAKVFAVFRNIHRALQRQAVFAEHILYI